MPPLPLPLVFEWLIDTLYKVISMQRVQSFSLPNQIKNDDKLQCLQYQWNSGRHSSAFFFSRFSLSFLTWSCLYQSFLSWHAAPLVFETIAAWWQCASRASRVCSNKPAAPQGYYGRQSSLNIHHTDTHRHTPTPLWSKRAHYLAGVLRSPAEMRSRLQLPWFVLLSGVSFTWPQFSATRWTCAPSPNISTIRSAGTPLIALRTKQWVRLIYL